MSYNEFFNHIVWFYTSNSFQSVVWRFFFPNGSKPKIVYAKQYMFGQYFLLFHLIIFELRFIDLGIIFFIFFHHKYAFEVPDLCTVFASLQLHNGFMLLLDCWSILFLFKKSKMKEQHTFPKLNLYCKSVCNYFGVANNFNFTVQEKNK